jgi:ubiquinone/menaquinone biosynthesis C-methylase UbiE
MTATATQPAFRGAGMEGLTAKWYANLTLKGMDEYRAMALRIAADLPPAARVLEVAPGPGYFAIELAKLTGARITGLDISRTFVEIARHNAAQAGVDISFRLGNASSMPFDDKTFDFIFCSAAFKNFADPVRALQEMHRVLDRGGRALIVDLRRDATNEAISQALGSWRLGLINRTLTKLTFRFMLLKRAYSKTDFERMLAQTKFPRFEIAEGTPISYEVSMYRA